MKVKVYFAVEDLGDGSAIERRFKSREELKAYIGGDSDVEDDLFPLCILESGSYIFDTDGYEVVE